MRKVKYGIHMEQLKCQDRTIEEIIINSVFRDRITYLNDTINEDSVFKARHYIERLVQIDKNNNTPKEELKPITIKISSPGGICTEGLSLISLMRRIQREYGYTVITHVTGEACSMAFVIALVGSKGYRYAEEFSEFMCHQPLQFKYNYYNLQEDLENLEHTQKLWEVLKGIIKENSSITEEQLQDITIRKFDWYMNSKEAKSLSVIDTIL